MPFQESLRPLLLSLCTQHGAFETELFLGDREMGVPCPCAGTGREVVPSTARGQEELAGAAGKERERGKGQGERSRQQRGSLTISTSVLTDSIFPPKQFQEGVEVAVHRFKAVPDGLDAPVGIG